MKKFLVYLVVILVAVSVGFTVFYLVRDNETISISTSSIYMREGDVVDDLGIIYDNKKSFSDYEVISSNEGIAKYDKKTGELTAVSGGIATITFRTSNVKFRNLSCQVYVGDGSLTSPYYIQTAEELRQIGKVTGEGENATVRYGLDKCYKLVNNINLAEGYTETGYWIPLATGDVNGFTGNFDGNGYTISNININKQAYIDEVDALEGFIEEVPNYRTYKEYGLFGKIGYNGRVCNLKVDNFNVSGDATLGDIGAIAGKNYGTIERCEVVSAYVGATGVNCVGGIVGVNESAEATITLYDAEGNPTNDYARYNGRIDRCIANVVLGVSKDHVEGEAITGVNYVAGGIAGANNGGIIIYSYSKGDIYLGTTQGYVGGIVGYNAFKVFNETNDSYLYPYTGAHVKDCYSLISIKNKATKSVNMHVGGIMGAFVDRSTLDLSTNVLEGVEKAGNVSKVIGNYYHKDNLNLAEGTEATTFDGIAYYCMDDDFSNSFDDTEFVVMGKTADELKLQATYKSHEQKEHIKNADTNEYEIISTMIPWKFDSVWYINENLNDGFPTLNFANIEVSDDLFDISDGSTIDSLAELQSMKLDGNYIITADITFGESDVWVPIGTVNKPFVGTLRAAAYIKNGVKDYYKIINLKTVADPTDTTNISREEYEYAGLFGVTSGAKGGKIEDIKLMNPIIVNGKVVGGIVGSNGYNSSVGNAAKSYAGMNIINCNVYGGTLTATQKVGAIAGENYGTISTCAALDYRDNNYNLISNAKVTLYGTSQGYAGGIVGYNGSVVTGCQFADSSAVVAESAPDLTFTVYVGGIAGGNSGTISNSLVITSNEVAINGLKGSIGGIAGVNQGTISNVMVKTAINAPVSNDQVYAGGVVGSAISKTSVNNAYVKNTSIRGYNAGGLAGIINYSTPNEGKYNLKVDKNYNYSLSNAPDTFASCAIDSTVAVEGKRAGGFAAIIDNGIIRNCYTRASLRGVDSGSVKAGFAVDLNLNPSTKAVGIIINCYNTCSFAKENGKNYSVSEKEILQDPLFDLGMDALKRDAGYCFNYAYVNQDGVTNPTNKDALVNLFKKDPAGTSLGSLQGTSPKHLTDRDFNQAYWTFNDGALPTLKGCDGLESGLTSIVNRKYTISFGSNVEVLKNGREIQSGQEIEKGDVLTVSYTPTERYSCTSFKINGEERENNTMYVVGTSNVKIDYAEEFSHFNVTVVVVGEGEASHSVGYAVKNKPTSVTAVPAAGYELYSIIITTESGSQFEYGYSAYSFDMPAENVTVTVTFKPQYTVTFGSDLSVTYKATTLKTATTGGTIVADALVTVKVTVPTGYELDRLVVLDGSNNEVEIVEGKFTMPNSNVTISAVYKHLGLVTKASNVKVYADEVLVTDTDYVLEGKTLTIEVTPETGYVVDTITVKTTSNVDVIVTDNTFVMPNEDVEITVTYVAE